MAKTKVNPTFHLLCGALAIATTVASIWNGARVACNAARFVCALQARHRDTPFDITWVCDIAQSYHDTSAHNSLTLDHAERLEVIEENIAHLLQRIPEALDARRNFALWKGGATVLPDLTSPTHLLPPHTLKTRLLQWLRGHDFYDNEIRLPITVLDDNIGVGECWEFFGTAGFISVALAEEVAVTELSINQIAPTLVSPQSAARSPQNMTLWGLIADNQLALETLPLSAFKHLPHPKPPLHPQSRLLRLTDVHYDLGAPHHQYFPISSAVTKLNLAFQIVLLEITSNWGSDTTCLYHLGIYGEGGGSI